MSEQFLYVPIKEITHIRWTCGKCKTSVELSLKDEYHQEGMACPVCGPFHNLSELARVYRSAAQIYRALAELREMVKNKAGNTERVEIPVHLSPKSPI